MTTDRYAALRAALEAGPTPGPREVSGPSRPSADTPEGGDFAILDGGTNIIAETFARVSEGVGGTRNAKANAMLFAAADPETIAALLKELDALREALKPFAEIPLEQIDTPETFGMDVLRARAALSAQERP